MKKIILLTATICFLLITATAQLSNTRWKGIINIPSPVDILWNFKQDTVQTFSFPDSLLQETMTFRIESNLIFFKKVTGTSPCDTTTIGTYKFKINDNKLFLISVKDDCEARKSSMSTDPYVKVE